MPQALVNKRIPKGYDWKSNEAFMAAVKKSELEVEGRGRVLIRPSGTEPLLRIMVECSDPELASDLAHRMADALAV
jgi:phosphoglucosamine mutase